MAPSIVISEIELGGRSGIDFLRIVRERSSVPFAFVTCTPSLAMVSVAHQLRCDAYLTKPTTAAEILEMTGLQTQSQYNNQPPLTLQHATRQYVVRILQDAGTIAEAARRLHLHKRSLRRMLGNRNSAQDATGGEYGAPDSQKDG